jgi:hypothetical protein
MVNYSLEMSYRGGLEVNISKCILDAPANRTLSLIATCNNVLAPWRRVRITEGKGACFTSSR